MVTWWGKFSHSHQTKTIVKPQNTKKSIKHKIPKKTTKHKTKKKASNIVQCVPIFSANGAGVVNKIESLVNSVAQLGAGLITLQETQFTRKGRLNKKIADFEFFEAIRKKQKRRNPDWLV